MDLEERVNEVIEVFCTNYEMFTSLDVSNYIKENSTFLDVRHRNIAEYVRYAFVDGLMNEYDYTRTLIDVELSNGASASAYLYHHIEGDPSIYDKRSQVAVQPKETKEEVEKEDVGDMKNTTGPISIENGTVYLLTDGNGNYKIVNKTEDKDELEHELECEEDECEEEWEEDDEDDEILSMIRAHKSDGRLEIPVEWVKKLGWEEGSAIFVVRVNNDKLGLAPLQNIDDSDDVLCITHISHGRLRVPKTAFVKASYDYKSKRKIEQEGGVVFVYGDSVATTFYF